MLVGVAVPIPTLPPAVASNTLPLVAFEVPSILIFPLAADEPYSCGVNTDVSALIVVAELMEAAELISPLVPIPPVTTSAPLPVPTDAVPELISTDPAAACGAKVILPPVLAMELTPVNVPVAIVVGTHEFVPD